MSSCYNTKTRVVVICSLSTQSVLIFEKPRSAVITIGAEGVNSTHLSIWSEGANHLTFEGRGEGHSAGIYFQPPLPPVPPPQKLKSQAPNDIVLYLSCFQHHNYVPRRLRGDDKNLGGGFPFDPESYASCSLTLMVGPSILDR